MRILHLYDEHSKVAPGWGSVVTVILNISKQMASMGHDVTIIERKWKDTPEVEFLDGIKFRRFKLRIGSDTPGRDVPYQMIKRPTGLAKLLLDRIEFTIKLNNYLKNESFDVLHIHVPFTANILIKINRKLIDKIVYTFHGGEERKRLGIDKSVPLPLKVFSPDLHLMRRVKICTVLNPMVKQILVEKGIEDEKIRIVPNGVNVNEFGNFDKLTLINVKKKYGIPDDRIIVMFAGTITPRKGVIHLVKAIEMVVKSGYRNVFLVLAGPTELDRAYFNEVYNYANSRLNGFVRLTGGIPYEDLKVLYSACDIFVLPSFEEGFGMVLTEAMASEKPLIGSNVGGIPMQIRDGWNGFLVELGNEKQLAERLIYLIENEEERKRMGRNSRRLAEEEFDWSKIAEKYSKTYREVEG